MGSIHSMKNFKLNTLLIYPPVYDYIYLPHENFPNLGLANLQGFLKSKGYDNVKIVDLDHMYSSNFFQERFKRWVLSEGYKIKSNLFDNFPFLKSLATPTLKYKILSRGPVGEFSVWSLKSILDKGLNDLVEFNRFKSLMKGLEGFDLVGFSVVYPEQLFSALICARLFKDLFPDVFVVFGGPMISKNLDFLLDQGLGGFVDGLIIGDGEVPLAELIGVLEGGKDLGSISNFYFLKDDVFVKGRGSVYCFNPVKDLVVPNFDGLNFGRKLPLRVSVGCPWGKCTFCDYRLTHKNYGCISAEKSVDLVCSLVERYGVNSIQFVDNDLGAVFLADFSMLILSSCLDIEWSCYLSFDPNFLKPSIVRLLSKAGCRKVYFGFESTSPRLLNLMNKPRMSLDKIKKVFELFHSEGIKVVPSVIFGFPSETKTEAESTLNFLVENKKLFFDISIQDFTLEQGTFVFDNPKLFGISKIDLSDKNSGCHFGFSYEVINGMSMDDAKNFTEYAKTVLS